MQINYILYYIGNLIASIVNFTISIANFSSFRNFNTSIGNFIGSIANISISIGNCIALVLPILLLFLLPILVMLEI